MSDALPERALEGRSLDTCEPETWCELVSTDHDLFAVFAHDSRAVFASGRGGVAFWDGSTWRWVTVRAPDNQLHDVWGSGPDDVWAAGGDVLVIHYDGQRWRRVHDDRAFMGLDLHAVHGTGPNDIWLVGQYGIVLHFDGTTWTQRWTPPRERSYGLWVVAPDDAWVIDERGQISHWDGERFALVGRTDPRFANHAWGLGSEGVQLGDQRWDGVALRATEVSTDVPVLPAWRAGDVLFGLRPAPARVHPRAQSLYRRAGDQWVHELRAGAIWGTPEGELYAIVGRRVLGRRPR